MWTRLYCRVIANRCQRRSPSALRGRFATETVATAPEVEMTGVGMTPLASCADFRGKGRVACGANVSHARPRDDRLVMHRRIMASLRFMLLARWSIS